MADSSETTKEKVTYTLTDLIHQLEKGKQTIEKNHVTSCLLCAILLAGDSLFHLRGELNMKAAICCRLSEEDRNKPSETDDSNSIQGQKALLLQYAVEQGWDVYRLYSCDDYIVSDRGRPEFNRLLADAQAHRFDIVLCKTQSRFTRELELVENYIHGLRYQQPKGKNGAPPVLQPPCGKGRLHRLLHLRGGAGAEHSNTLEFLRSIAYAAHRRV